MEKTPEAKLRFWSRVMWIALITLIVSFLIGISITIRGMTQAFGQMTAGASEPSDLAEGINSSIADGSVVTGILGPIAFIALIIAVIRIQMMKRRQA